MPQGMQISKEKQKEIYSRLADAFLTKTQEEWTAILWQADASVSPANGIEEMPPTLN